MQSLAETLSPASIAPQTAALRRLPPYVFAELDRLKAAARGRGMTLTDLGIGSPDVPINSGVLAALEAANRDPATHGYPAFRGAPVYFDAIGEFMQARFDVTIDPAVQAIALSGAKEGLAQLSLAICEPGDLVLIPEIYYPVYARSAWLAGAEVRWLPMRAEDGFVVDLDAIAQEDARRARLLIVNYPNNPTGARVERAFYEDAVAFARRNEVLLVSDLAYSELTFDGTPAPSALACDPEHEVTIEFHSFSKTFGMAGLRVGFATGNREAIEALAAYRTNIGYGTPTGVQHAAAHALQHRDSLVPATVQEYRRRRDAMAAAFAEAGWHIPIPAAGMYLWLPVPEGVNDWTWVQTLIDLDGIVVTPGMAFGHGGSGFFRVSLVRNCTILERAAAIIAARRATLLPSA